MNSGRNLRFSTVGLWRPRLDGWKRGRVAGRLGEELVNGCDNRASRWEV